MLSVAQTKKGSTSMKMMNLSSRGYDPPRKLLYNLTILLNPQQA